MKKLLFFGIASTLLGCTSDTSENEVCTNKVWAMVQNCNPENTSCNYMATYGETQATAGSIQVNLATYNFYSAQGNTSNGSICWNGTK